MSSQKRDGISGTYSRDYNILEADNIIRRKFSSESQSRKMKLSAEIRRIDTFLARPQTAIRQRKLLQDREQLTRELDAIEDESELRQYTERTENLLRRYSDLRPSISIRAFGQKDTDLDQKDKERLELIETFLEIAKDYIPISISREKKISTGCPHCGSTNQEVETSDNGMSYCIDCGIERKILIQFQSQRDSSTELQANSNHYETRGNFYKALIRFQGKQQDCLPRNIEQILDTYFTARGFPSGEEVRKMTLLDHGRRCDKTSGKWMHKALSDTGLSSYYEHWRLICKKYWGWELLDLGQLEDCIMDYYDRTHRILEEIPNKRRKAALNAQFQLRGILMGMRVRVIDDDFKIIKTEDTIAEHENHWSYVCKQINLEYVPI